MTDILHCCSPVDHGLQITPIVPPERSPQSWPWAVDLSTRSLPVRRTGCCLSVWQSQLLQRGHHSVFKAKIHQAKMPFITLDDPLRNTPMTWCED